jgi:serine/threonine protein kinase
MKKGQKRARSSFFDLQELPVISSLCVIDPDAKLGKGVYGTVFKAVIKNDNGIGSVQGGTTVAVKHFSDDCKVWEKLAAREIKALRKLNGHPNIVHLIQIATDDRTRSSIYMLMECAHSDLSGLIAARYENGKMVNRGCAYYWAEGQVKGYAQQLLLGLEHCHKNGIVHGDIKPHNLLIMPKDGRLVIADFGLAENIGANNGGRVPHTFTIVTQWYRAPELLMAAKDYGAEVDVWAAGCVIAEMMLCKPLFPGTDHNESEQLSLIWRSCGLSGAAPPQQWPADLERRVREEVRRMNGPLERKLSRTLNAAGSGAGGKDLNKHQSVLTSSAGAIPFIDHVLVTFPALRPTATQALAHPWLAQQLPKPYVSGQFYVERQPHFCRNK